MSAHPFEGRSPDRMVHRAPAAGVDAAALAARLAALTVAALVIAASPTARAAGPAAPPGPLLNQACVNEAVARLPDAATYAGRVEVKVSAGGGLAGVRLLEPSTPEQTEAVGAALARCPWPALQGGEGTLQLQLERRAKAGASHREAPPEVTPGPPPPPVSLDGKSLNLSTAKAAAFRRPVLVDDGCLLVMLRGKPRLAGLEAKVKFAVLRDGSVTQLSFLEPVEPEVAELVEAAFARCRWVPAADPQGTPLAVWVVLPLRIAHIAEVGEAP